MSLFCLFLLGHPVSEMFYWPMAVLAYLTSMAAISAVFWSIVLLGNESRKARWISSVLMVVAAASVEAGAIFVAVFCGLVLLAEAFARRRSTLAAGPLLWLAMPLFVSTGVIVAIYSGRVSAARELLGDPAVAHHVLPVLWKSALIFVGEMMSIDGREISFRGLALGIATKALFVAGVFGTIGVHSGRVSPARRRLVGILSLACFASAFLILCASLYHFGSACCERHKTFRMCLEFLGFAAAAVFLAMANRHGRKPGPGAGRSAMFLGCLLASVLLAGYQTAPRIAHDYRNYRLILDAAAHNWTEGMKPGESMIFRQWRGAVVGGPLGPDRTYTRDDADWWVGSVMQFFGKKAVTFVTDDS